MRIAIVSALVVASALGAAADTYDGDPTNYKTQLGLLQPGDTLNLAAGDYTGGLTLTNMAGLPGSPITIQGPETGDPAVFLARAGHNTIQLNTCSYLTLRRLKSDGLDMAAIHALDADGECHDITLESLLIVNHGNGQQTCGIAANGSDEHWNWVIRDCTITGAGTGMYLGQWAGNGTFATALIEDNVVLDTVGYCCQIKVENDRPAHVPEGVTIIRNNVFSKVQNGGSGNDGARPNLLVDPFPAAGRGSNDIYLIYGNLFYQNYENDALFQGTGNIAFYDNLLVNEQGTEHAVHVQPHNGNNRKIRVFFNTIVAGGNGVQVSGTEGTDQYVFGNAVFAGTPLNLDASVTDFDNVTDAYENADLYLNAPFALLGELDLYPLEGALLGEAVDTTTVNDLTDWNLDFNGRTRTGIFRGAYAGQGENPGWVLDRDRKDNDDTPANTLPVAVAEVAEPGEVVSAGTAVTLSGLKSYDPDGYPSGGIQSYTWVQTAGQDVTLDETDPAQPVFTPTLPGDYTFRLVVNDGAANSTDASSPDNTVTVTAVGTKPPEGPGEIALDVTTLAPTCESGRDAAQGSFEVWNAGGGILDYTLSDDVAWLECVPSWGSSSGAHDTIGVAYATSALAEGEHTATITVSADGATNTPQTIAVTLTVTPPGSGGGDDGGDDGGGGDGGGDDGGDDGVIDGGEHPPPPSPSTGSSGGSGGCFVSTFKGRESVTFCPPAPYAHRGS